MCIRTHQRITDGLTCPFLCKLEARRFLIQQFAAPHHAEMFRPAHRKLYVAESGGFEFVVCLFYLSQAHGFGQPVETLALDDPREITGVNSRKELADVTAILNQTRIDALMAAGVTIVDPASTWV